MQVNNTGLSSQIVRNQPNSEQLNQQAERAAEQVREQQKQQAEQTQRVNRIEVDENAIAVLERENAQRQNSSAQSNGSNNQSSDSQTSYDTPPSQNATAIATYQSVNNIERRDNVQQLLGVDVFA
ncbi:hypothetical protein HII17_07150 [Thalassotalea sp. M1531]|uniref:Uncharacterized protein n=1 Tax=Thalassotalea algicola TaxID=2716224 RepID=A0A7Y0LBS9_9GAMM|nr:hypothetical protein [Thalassotalea algicola]NMP31334.1 hypothetical protein [Thalassotalea algicola]